MGWGADSRLPRECLLQIDRQRGGIFRRTGYSRRLQAKTLPLAIQLMREPKSGLIALYSITVPVTPNADFIACVVSAFCCDLAVIVEVFPRPVLSTLSILTFRC